MCGVYDTRLPLPPRILPSMRFQFKASGPRVEQYSRVWAPATVLATGLSAYTSIHAFVTWISWEAPALAALLLALMSESAANPDFLTLLSAASVYILCFSRSVSTYILASGPLLQARTLPSCAFHFLSKIENIVAVRSSC
jgi:hypothetical protein